MREFPPEFSNGGIAQKLGSCPYTRRWKKCIPWCSQRLSVFFRCCPPKRSCLKESW